MSFSFGRNWQKYLDHMPESAVERQMEYVRGWLGDLTGRAFLDIGSGSGLTALAAHRLGARVRTFDADPQSVAATGRLAEWENGPGSILDEGFVDSLGTFDVVSSWGVLHHTGDVFRAIENAARLVGPDGVLWIALYLRTYATKRSLRTKRLYNRSPGAVKAAWRMGYAGAKWAKNALRGNLRPWHRYDQERGMSWFRDIEDWLGGLPYEPVGPGEVMAHLPGFELVRLEDALGEGRLCVYLFQQRGGRHQVKRM